MVVWLAREAKCPLSEVTLIPIISSWPVGARSTADLEPTVRVLVEQEGCPPGDSAGAAASRGHLALARYLHEELGSGFSGVVLFTAAVQGCEAGLEWLVGKGCVVREDSDVYRYTYMQAAAPGDLATLRCLRRLDVPWDPNVLTWVARGSVPLPVLRWLVEQGAPWDEALARKAVCVPNTLEHPGWREALAWFEARLATGSPKGGDGASGQVAEATG